MDSAKLKDREQVLGIFALVASIVFMGTQLKPSQDIASAQASQKATGATIEVLVRIAESPLFLPSSEKTQAGAVDTLTTE